MKTYKLLPLLFIFLVVPYCSWAAQNISAASVAALGAHYVNGGTTYAALLDGDISFVFIGGTTRSVSVYIYDDDSNVTVDNIIYIKPDNTSVGVSYNGTARWVLCQLFSNGIDANMGAIVGGMGSIGTVATPITSSGAYTLTAANCWGKVLYYNDTDPINLPTAVLNMTIGIYVAGTSVTNIHPQDSTDTTTIGGVDNAAGHYFTIPGVKGNLVILHCDVANHWVSWGLNCTATLE